MAFKNTATHQEFEHFEAGNGTAIPELLLKHLTRGLGRCKPLFRQKTQARYDLTRISPRKNLPRLAVLFASPTHLSAGFVLRVVFSRIHCRRIQPATSLAAIGRATSTGELNHWRPVPTARQPVPAQPTTVSDPVLFPKCFGDDQLAAESLHSLRTQLIGCTEKLGITGIDTLNCLRAGGASDYFARGLPRWWVCRQGGWSPRSTTVDIYNRPTPFQRAAVAEVYNKSVVTVAGGDNKEGQSNGQVE